MNDQPARSGVMSQDQLRSYDGLALLRAIIAGELPGPPMMQTLNFRLSEVSEGRAVFTGTPQLAFYNPLGSVHGGWAATLLDSALGCAVHTALKKGEGYATLELKINMVRPIMHDTGPVRAEGKLIYRGRSVGTADGQLTDLSGKLYAHASTTCMIFPASPATG